jgi:UrcA family protein
LTVNKTVISGALLALTLSGAALAAPQGASVQVHASTRGLDLNQAAGAQIMLRRLDAAAASACGASSFSAPQMKRETRRSDCYKAAMQGAVGSLGAPVVTSLYQGQEQRYASR